MDRGLIIVQKGHGEEEGGRGGGLAMCWWRSAETSSASAKHAHWPPLVPTTTDGRAPPVPLYPCATFRRSVQVLLSFNNTSVFFSVHPPVLSSAPIWERNHGHATARNGVTCWSVQGESQNGLQIPNRDMHNHQETPAGHASARKHYKHNALPATTLYSNRCL